MLWGLLAVLIPLVVHLFNLRRYHKVYFSNVERLSALQTESRRRNTVRQWWVLAMRMLAVALLVLAFARPMMRPKGASTMSNSNAVVSLYIDNSFSMEGATEEGSLLDAAKQKAREAAAAYGMETRYQLLTGTLGGDELRWLSRDELMEAIDAVEPAATSRLMSEVAKRQSDFLKQSGAPSRHAYLIGDFQQSTADLDALPVDSSVVFTLVPLKATGADNVWIDTVRLDAPAYFVGGNVEVLVTLRNGGIQAVEKVPVRLYVDGRERAIATLDLAANATGSASLRFSIDRAGWIDGCVKIEDYPITFDDSYHFALQAGERVEMVEVGPAAPSESLQRLFGQDSAVHYRSERHLPAELEDCQLVVLSDVASLTTGETRQLAEWVEGGGNLLVIPPAGVADGLNPLLEQLRAPQLAGWQKRTVRAMTIDYQSSLYQGVFASQDDEVELPTVQGHYALVGNQAVQQSILALADGGELLTLTPAGEGRVYLFTCPLSSEWSNFASQALFVPTLYNIALYSRPQPAASHTLGTETTIPLQGRYEANRSYELTGGEEVALTPDLRRVGGRQLLVLHGELTEAGIYRLADEHLAFNYPRRESEMRFLSADEVAKAAAQHYGYTVVRPTHQSLTEELQRRGDGRQLWRLCLWLALAALAAETVLLKLKR